MSRKLRKTQVLLAAVAVSIVVPVSSAAEPRSIDQAIERGFDYFSSVHLRGDQLFFVSQAALLLGGQWPARARSLTLEPGIEHPVELGLIELRFHPLTSAAVDSTDLATVEATEFSAALTKGQVQEIFFFMQVALECRDRPAADVNALGGWLLRPGSGYLVAHQLVAMTIAESLGCVEGDASAVVDALAGRVYRELLSTNSFDDLVAEQVAVLCLAGYGQQIPRRYFETMLTEQGADGSWGLRQLEVNDSVFTPVGHTAALALYGLACYQRQLSRR